MKQIPPLQFMIKLCITTIVIGSLVLSGCRSVPETEAASDKYRLVWTDDPTSTITIAWDQLESGNPEVWYGTTDEGRRYWEYPDKAAPQRTHAVYEMNTHFAKLTGLQSDTEYYFVIRDEKGVSKRYWFRTAPAKPKAFTFMAGGDTKSDDAPLEAGRASNRMVGKLRPLFVLFNGDFTSGDGTDAGRWHQWLNDWQAMTTTPDGRMIPVVPVHGNHENGDRANLNHIFNAPFQQNDTTQIYYSLSFGDNFFHIISLNSEIDEGGAQKAWLANDLQKHKDYTFKIAGYHKPFWPHTSGKRENEYQYHQWASLFYEYGLDVSLDGDSHMHKITYPLKPDSISAESHMGFVRDDENGTLFIGEGSWGAFPRVADDEKPWTIATGACNQVKWIHVFPEGNNQPAHMNIHTVVTATYDEEERQTLYGDNVQGLTESNLFEVPANLQLLENGNYGTSVKYPFSLNKEPEVAVSE